MMLDHEKKRRLLCVSVFVLIDGWTLIQKNGGKKSFSYESKASTSFIPIRRMWLWCPIMKKMKLLHASMFVRIDGIIMIPKNGGKKSFSYHTKASISSIQMRRMCLLCPIITCINVCPTSWMNFDSKKIKERKAFLMKPKRQCHLSQRA